MIFYSVIVIIAIFASISGETLAEKKKELSLLFFGFFLVLIAGFKSASVDPDSSIYLKYYNQASPLSFLFSRTKYFFNSVDVEPTFILISSFFKRFFHQFGYRLIFIVFSFFSVLYKTKSIIKYSDFKYYSFLAYLCSIFFLHDMIQVRVSLASAIALMSFQYIIDRDFIRFSIIILIATLFHYSCILFFIFYFINNRKINVSIYTLGIAICIFLSLFHYDLASILLKYDFGVYSEKAKLYFEIQSWEGYRVNKFNLIILFQIAYAIFLMFNSEKLILCNRYSILFLKIYLFGIYSFYLFSELAVFSFRIMELLIVVQIFLIPYVIYLIKPKFLAQLIVVLICLLYYTNFVYQSLLNEYAICF